MPLGWREITQRAVRFGQQWSEAGSERAEKQTFWNEFFDVFGVRRRTVASFEEPVRGISGHYGYIDLFWRGILLVEHKSRGLDLGAARSQAFAYIQDLVRDGRTEEVPRYVIVSDFARIALHDLEPEESGPHPKVGDFSVQTLEFPLADLHRCIRAFAFIPGYKQHKFEDQDPINLRAVAIMGRLHDALAEGGYRGHALERFLVRMVFCLFAEDTGIFERDAFRLFLEQKTREDGSDLGSQLAHLFQVLNTPVHERQRNLDELLAPLQFVNGDLFAEDLGFAEFNRDMRNALLACTRFDWSRISPAIFGSLFLEVMEPRERRQLGGHYTSERDILKVIRGQFLDELRTEFQRAKGDKTTLRRFRDKLASLRFLDPACGCGNFLVVSYREMRLLEMEVLALLNGKGQQELPLPMVDVDAFFGIEILEWPVRIAEVAMWLMDHQMNLRFSETTGEPYARLPLRKSPRIVQSNALRIDWSDVLPAARCTYVLGNPPFVGKKEQNPQQKEDLAGLFGDVQGAGVLDYVCGWYRKAADYIRGTKVKVAFVSTNSITQGEQVGVLWKALLDRYGLRIHFAHRTFAWESEARGKAHVHVVIVGFAACNATRRTLYEYEDPRGEPHVFAASNINPYLADAPNVLLTKRSIQVGGGPRISYGSMANDRRKGDKGPGNLILTEEDRSRILGESRALGPHIRPFVGSEEFLNGTRRWCLWLVDAPSSLLRESPTVIQRIAAVRRARSESGRAETRELAKVPHLFGEIRQPRTRYLLIPKVSSETRYYLPIGFFPPSVIANGSALIIADATLFDFGVLSSAMHMAWMRYTCGRMKSDFQYSSRIVYNNFPWPSPASDKPRRAVEDAARRVLAARKAAPADTPAELYDPLCMARDLVKAHRELDRAVDRCYRPKSFGSEQERVRFLFALLQTLLSR
ncbi:MAG: class I SAM-dependent DNA methyltransferase [Deltaproteobacteria bacterium]|nr:class I SAM-dependent DNA methyltransferase [Deltaproteobacteria bacterium]